MGPLFQHDLSRVRVHTGGLADTSARAVNATAYTVGHDIVFAANQYSPGTPEGKKLIAHELSHTIQQRKGNTSTSLDLNAAENEADQASERIVSGREATIGPPTPKQLARKEREEPFSLNRSFNVGSETPEALEAELRRIVLWLEAHPGSSLERTRLEGIRDQIIATLKRLDQAAGRTSVAGVVDIRPFSKSPQQIEEARTLDNRFAPPGAQVQPIPSNQPSPAKAESAEEKFIREHQREISQLPLWSEHFAAGVARSPFPSKLGEAWELLKGDLTSASRGVRFYMGVQVGVPVGAFNDVYGQATGFVQMLVQAYFLKMKIEADPLKAWAELKKFVQSLPGKLVQLFDAEQVGFAVGQLLAAKTKEFGKDPFDRGRTIGEIIGTVLMEIALMFVGVEEVSAAVKGLRVAKLEGEVAHAMAIGSKELKAVIEARGVLNAESRVAGAAAKEAKAAGAVEKEGARAVAAAESAAEQELQALGKLDNTTRTRLKDNPTVRRALVDNELAARALKKCASPCFPEGITEEQIESLQHILQEVNKTGKYDEGLLNQYLYNRRANLDTAIKDLRGGVDAKTFNDKLDFFVNRQGEIKKGVPQASPGPKIHVKEPDLPPEVEGPGTSTRKQPKKDIGGKEEPPRRAEAGQFAHEYRERLERLLDNKEEWRNVIKGREKEFVKGLPEGWEPEHKIPVPELKGHEPRPDRVNWNDAEVIEIKPATRERQGLVEAQQYAEYMNKYEKRTDGKVWKPKVVTYDLDELVEFLEKIGYLKNIVKK